MNHCNLGYWLLIQSNPHRLTLPTQSPANLIYLINIYYCFSVTSNIFSSMRHFFRTLVLALLLVGLLLSSPVDLLRLPVRELHACPSCVYRAPRGIPEVSLKPSVEPSASRGVDPFYPSGVLRTVPFPVTWYPAHDDVTLCALSHNITWYLVAVVELLSLR